MTTGLIRQRRPGYRACHAAWCLAARMSAAVMGLGPLIALSRLAEVGPIGVLSGVIDIHRARCIGGDLPDEKHGIDIGGVMALRAPDCHRLVTGMNLSQVKFRPAPRLGHPRPSFGRAPAFADRHAGHRLPL